MNIDTIPASTVGQAQDPQTQHCTAAVAPVPVFHDEPINILIVDDEPKNLTVLETVLDDPGYRLVRAESADQALLALVAEEFALPILDIRMPGMNGFELAQMIKGRKKTAQVPIIFLTAYYNEDQHVLEGYGTGAVDYLHKPVNPAILRSKVAVFADLYSKNRALLAEMAEHRRADEELRELNATLEQRVTDRTEALRESEGKFRALLETAPDAIVIVDQQGIIVLANAVTEQLFGYSRAELLGQRVEMLMPTRFHNRHEVHRKGYLAVPHTRRMAGRELLGQRKDGSEFPIEVSLSPLETDQGTLVSSVLRDITVRKADEDKLKLALNYAEAVLNTAHQPFLVLDGNLHILRANPAFYKTFKTTPETTEGCLLYDLGDRQWDIPELRDFLQDLLLKDTSFKDCEITHAFPNIGKKTMRLNGKNLTGVEQFKILLAIEDVSDYRTAINYAETTIKTVTQPFLVLDENLCIIRANPAFYKSFKTTPETTEGRLLYDLGDRQWDIPELRDFLQALLLKDTSFKDCEITHAFPNVGKKTMRLNGTPLVGGEHLQILLAIEDVSDYRTALNTLKDNDRHKDEFLAMLAHELRNPLTPIRNALEIIKRGGAGEKEQKERQTIMDRQLQKMVRLVDDLLDVSRITRGVIVLKKEPVDLVQLVNQTVESVRGHFETRQHELSLSLPKEGVLVNGDPIRLEQIVSNLLINAAKYTEPGGHITVTLECEGDNALIRVIDNGIGISSDILPYIFDLFVQAGRSLDRTQGGLGIGLTLVRRLVELQGGTVEAKSEGLKRGSEFIVRLPMMPEMEAALPVTPTVASKKAPI